METGKNKNDKKYKQWLNDVNRIIEDINVSGFVDRNEINTWYKVA